MPGSKLDFNNTTDEEARDRSSSSSDALTDRFGIRAALIGLCIASVIAAIWFVRSPSFEKCSAIENVTERNACYEALRKDFLRPPAKGADIPIR